MTSHTVPTILARTCKTHGTQKALAYKTDGTWHFKTWLQYNEEVYTLAQALAFIGVSKGDCTAILASNCVQWLEADVATILTGAIPTGIYTTSSAEQCQYVIDHCKAKIVFVENKFQLEKINKIKRNCPSLLAIIVMREKVPESPGVYNWDSFLNYAHSFSRTEIEKIAQALQPDDVATLVYTSGTTANPKAVMLTHRNITWMSEVVVTGDLQLLQDDVLISYLPLSHVAEQMTTIHGPMFAGTCVYMAESFERLAENLKEVKPTLFLGVPRVWEKIHEKMAEKTQHASPLQKLIANWAMKQGLKKAYAVEQGKSIPISYFLAKKLVFNKVKAALGLSRCRLAISAAAPISKEILEFFWSLDIPVYELYGMSECTGPTTISLPNKSRIGQVGLPLQETEVTIAEDGEILVKGPHVFKGYLNDEATTAQTLVNGVLHTGDIGIIDQDGFLKITGRKKNLIITAGGENIAPELLESKCSHIRGVAHAVVVGDRKKYLSLLITLDPIQAKVLSKEIGSKAQNLQEMAKCDKISNYVQQEIEQINQDVARVQTIKTFKILQDSFSEDTGELTPTLKVKRDFVLKKYKEEIENLYI